MPPKAAAMKSSSSNGTESGPLPVNQRKTPPETSSPNESLRKVSDEWKEGEKFMRKVLENSKVYSQMDEFVQDYAMQKKKADLNQKKVEELEIYGKLQLDGFTQKYDEWQEKERQLRRDLGNAEKDSRDTYSEKIEDLKASLETTRKEKSALQAQLATTRKDCKEAREESDVWRKKTQRYEQDLAQLDDTALKTCEGEAKDLMERGLRLFVRCFGGDLPGTHFTTYSEWLNYENDLELTFRLPASNSPAAKAVRLAASLHIFASSLSTISSCSWYNPASVSDSETVAKVLQISFKDDIRKKNLARSLFLSTSQRRDVQAAVRTAAGSASQTVFEKLRFFVVGSEPTFRSDLDKLFQDWADFWVKMQYSEEQVEATLEEERLDSADAWLSMKEFGDESQMQGMGNQSVPLFPCIYTAATEKVIQPGYFLYLDQELVVSAKREAEDMARSKNRVRKDHGRRKSASMFASGALSNIGRVAEKAHHPI